MAPALQLENEFWQFSLAVYETPGVAAECLALQEAQGIDVNLLLFCAWLGAARGTVLTQGDVVRAMSVVQVWHDQAVRPLRAIRQQLKVIAAPGREPFRARVKALELDAEQIEEAMLFAHARETWPTAQGGKAREVVTVNVGLYLQTHGKAGTAQGKDLSTRCLIDAAVAAAAGAG